MSELKNFTICLVNPPVIQVLEPWYDTPDFGRTALAYLAGYLREHSSCQVHIIDAKFERLSFNQVTDRLLRLQPDLVGLTAFTNEVKPAAYQANQVKKALPFCTTVIGGVHVTSIPNETMEEFPFFDIGVVGEGEQTLLELCVHLQSGKSLANVNGIIYRDSGILIKTEPRERILDQDSIPFPAWDLLPPAKNYFIQSIRGCPFNCLFCMNPNGRVARKRSVPNVIEEMEWIINDFRPEHISFGDELFSVDMTRTHELLRQMANHRIGERVKWDVQTHVRYVNRELFLDFKKANVERVEVGIETGDDDALRTMGKGTNRKMIIDAVQAGKEAGVSIGSFFLFGQPNETPETIAKTIDLAVEVNPDLPMFGLMTPYPGTEVARLAAQNKAGYRIISTDWDDYNKQLGGALEFANLNRKQIEWLQTTAYLKVYLLNGRFKDLMFFLWEYRHAGWEVLKKMIHGNQSALKASSKPADYDGVLSSGERTSKDSFISARQDWNQTQVRELKRAKLKSPHLAKSINSKKSA